MSAPKRAILVRINAPDSAYHGWHGHVDAKELKNATKAKRDTPVTVHLTNAPGPATIAYPDELETVAP